ncbi:hypothetical protein [uncultured Rikenella sp.]|uniref:hypothetical protein n=1 Tax=uncultured Rikenella sp. TaxID=368003 RepID=UPI0025E7AF50|nr:hypothetical protein [uncultured Rikenella sp.]
MKKAFFFFGFICLFSCPAAVSQISIRESNIIEKAVPRSERFDSMSNIHSFSAEAGHNLKQYLEQEIFMVPMTPAALAQDLGSKNRVQQAKRKEDSVQALYQKYTDSIGRLEWLSYKRENRKNLETINAQISELKKKRADLPIVNKYQVHHEEYKPFDPYSPRSHGFYTCDSSGNIKSQIPYIDIQNKYYTIIDIMEITQRNPTNEIVGSIVAPTKQYVSNLAFLLKQKDGDHVLWFINQPNFDFMTRFSLGLLTSYFEKNKTLFEDKNFISTHDYQYNLVDVSTGELVQVKPGSRWTCEEFSLTSLEKMPLMVPFFFLKNQAGETIKVQISKSIRDTNRIDGFMTESHYLELQRLAKMQSEQRLAQQRAEEKQRTAAEQQKKEQFKKSCIDKWGEKLGTLISAGQVTLGMNQEMCRTAWGKPFRINRTTVAGLVSEQWVYGGHNYLYFENGILVSIQN